MTCSKLIALLAIILPFYLSAAEPSAFGAGDLSNPNPYGLTSSESTILETKQNLRKVVVKSNNQANEVDSLRERIDGLQTIIESISNSSRNNKLKLKSLDETNTLNYKNSSEYEKRLTESIQETNKLILMNSEEIEKIKLVIAEMSKLIDKINLSYVTKNEFNLLVNDVNKFKGLVAKELKKSAKPKKSKLEKISNADVAKKAKAYYAKKFYTKALVNYNHLIKNNYKPAYAHYMVGEINYYRKNYSDAIAYFKKSASLYSKASYIPVLMLHTAISMDKTGDKNNAATFYNAVITKYPQSSAAKIAKNKLSLIE